MKIVLKHPGENDEIATCKCGAELETQAYTDDSGVIHERGQFAFALTHKKNGAQIKDLATKGAFLGIIELGWCNICQHHSAVLDSTDDPKYWASLPKWHKPV